MRAARITDGAGDAGGGTCETVPAVQRWHSSESAALEGPCAGAPVTAT